MSDYLHIEVISHDSLSETLKREIIGLCNRAYQEELESYFNMFADPTYVLGYYHGSLVSHALWITRWLQVGTKPLMRTAYIEVVATDEAFRNRGFASAIMKRIAQELQNQTDTPAQFDLAALSPFSIPYYRRLGWEEWRGRLFIRTDEGLLASPEDEEVMILRLPKSPELDLDAPLSIEWREYEPW